MWVISLETVWDAVAQKINAKYCEGHITRINLKLSGTGQECKAMCGSCHWKQFGIE